jgi:ATP-dependent RNA helicase RhlE
MVERFFGREGTYGLILAPTREIAQQIQTTIEIFGAPRGIRSVVLIGGVNMRHDAIALNTYPHIIVATPGRLCDHLDRGNLWLDFIEVLVLDEADRMLDMGFSDQLARITSELPASRQTLLFSATIPPEVQKLSDRILKDPKRITVGKPLSANRNITQSGILVREEDKNWLLRKVLKEELGSIIVFTRSKDGATRVWRSLHSSGIYDATYIHSDRMQKDRESALAEFKSGKFRILIATDVAARGIHVEDVAMVINYDLPMEPEDYIHRIGRTGRVNASGKAVTFITPRDRAIIGRIEALLKQTIPIEGGSMPPSGPPRGPSGPPRGPSGPGRAPSGPRPNSQNRRPRRGGQSQR